MFFELQKIIIRYQEKALTERRINGGMQEMGMTDLQFKSWLKQIIRGLEGAKGESTKEDTDKKIEELLKDLKEDLQG